MNIKKIKARSIAFLTSLAVLVLSVVPTSSITVSALSAFPTPTKSIIVGDTINSDMVHTFTETLISNYNFIQSGFETSNTFVYLFVESGVLKAWVLKDTGTERTVSYNDKLYTCFYSQPILVCGANLANGYCNTCDINNNTTYYVNTLCYLDGRYSKGQLRNNGTGGAQAGFDNNGDGFSDYAVFPLEPEFNPIINPLYRFNYGINVNVEKFTEWLIDTGKYTEIASTLTQNRVQGLVSIFSKYGGNNGSFIDNLRQYFKFISIAQYVDDYSAVVNKVRALYQEFQKSEQNRLMDIFFHRTDKTDTIKPVTNDDDLTLITDTEDDDVIVSILRDILRSLIALPNNIANLINALNVKLDDFETTVNVVTQSGTPDFPSLWEYSDTDFHDDLTAFTDDVSASQQIPNNMLSDINDNSLMPEKMLSDKDSLVVHIPNISGFTVSDDGKNYSTQTTSYTISSDDYPWLDPMVKKIKSFTGILLVVGYLVSLRFRLPEIIRGE